MTDDEADGLIRRARRGDPAEAAKAIGELAAEPPGGHPLLAALVESGPFTGPGPADGPPPSEADLLRAELLTTAAWLDERAAILEQVVVRTKLKAIAAVLRDEAVRVRGRAALLRVVVDTVRSMPR